MNSPARNELIQQLLQNIGVLSRLSVGRMTHGIGRKGMPTHAQLGIMFVLMHHKAQGIKSLAAQFGISSSATTQLVNSMVADGLLVRREDSADRRSVKIDLTPKGAKKLALVKSARLKMMSAMFEPLSDQELKQFLDLQRKMSDHLQHTCLPSTNKKK